MWGIIPAAGNGTRIQPLAFSKELLPVGDRDDGERPKAVSEYLYPLANPQETKVAVSEITALTNTTNGPFIWHGI